MKRSEASPDTYDEEYILHFLLDPLPKFTSRSRSAEFKDILPWSISQMIMKTVPINTVIVISNAMKWGTPL